MHEVGYVPSEAYGAIVAALIAAVLSFFGLIISKEQKVSEFRQAWIDALRSEAADLVAYLNVAADGWSARGDDPNISPLRENMLGANRAMTLIRLRLNPTESKSKAVLEIIDAAAIEFLKDDIDLDRLQIMETDFSTQMQILLKYEWDRVRKGEPVFYFSQWIAAICAFGLIAYVSFSMAV